MSEFLARIALGGLTQIGILLPRKVQLQFAEILRDPNFAEEVKALGVTTGRLPEDINLPCRVVELVLLHVRSGGKTIEDLLLETGLHAKTCEACRQKIAKVKLT